MTTYIIYDSNYGSTRMIAEKIARSLPVEATVLHVRDVDPQALATVDFVIIGSPTIGGQPTEAIKTFLHRIPAPVHPGAQAAASPTRYANRAGLWPWSQLASLARERVRAPCSRVSWNARPIGLASWPAKWETNPRFPYHTAVN